MIDDLFSEELISLTQAAKILPARRAGKKTTVNCLYRWTTHGCRGVKLESVQIGSTRCCTKQSLQRFFEQLTAREANCRLTTLVPQPAKLPANRRRQVEAAEKNLDAAGISNAKVTASPQPTESKSQPRPSNFAPTETDNAKPPTEQGHLKEGSRITKEEANIRARAALKNPKLRTVRKLAKAIGCSPSLVPKLPAWRAYQEKLEKRGKIKTGIRDAVPLTNEILETHEQKDPMLEQLFADQERDFEASPLVPHVPHPRIRRRKP